MAIFGIYLWFLGCNLCGGVKNFLLSPLHPDCLGTWSNLTILYFFKWVAQRHPLATFVWTKINTVRFFLRDRNLGKMVKSYRVRNSLGWFFNSWGSRLEMWLKYPQQVDYETKRLVISFLSVRDQVEGTTMEKIELRTTHPKNQHGSQKLLVCRGVSASIGWFFRFHVNFRVCFLLRPSDLFFWASKIDDFKVEFSPTRRDARFTRNRRCCFFG